MSYFDATAAALQLLVSGDAALWRIIYISLRVSLLALLIAAPAAILLGYLIATRVFPARRVTVILIQSSLSFPTVVVGLVLYLLLTRNGIFGDWQLLFTQNAMIIGQAVIAFPVLLAFTLAAVQGADPRVKETALSLGASPLRAAFTTLSEVRFAMMAGVVNAFGRVISEIGCSMMVGGNIAGATRNIPTAIALETSKGNFVQGIALGIVLVALALGINWGFAFVQGNGGLE